LAKPIIALIGRQNVGKSTLLNGIEFTVVDTGGMEFQQESVVARGVRKQAEVAISEADVIIFLTDAREGIMPLDNEIANIIRKSEKPVVLVVNKVDNDKQQSEAAEFYQLGFEEVVPISAYHGRGVADLLDRVVSLFPVRPNAEEVKTEGLKVAIVGHPHVGKSLLLNTLLGKERTIVGDTPGTTRDAIDTVLDFKEQPVILIDTAGIRRRGKVSAGIEFYSVLRSMRAIDRADIALLVVDATEPVTAQDAHITGYIEKAGKGIVLLVNKWDLVTDKNKEVYNEYIQGRLKFATWVPVLYISAKVGTGTKNIMPLVFQIQQERSIRIPDEDLNNLTKEAVSSHNLPHKGKKILQVYSASQTAINPPTFRFLVNDSQIIHFSYERFLENKLREAYGFNGTPIRLVFKSRG
jgi:GTP-binding protein